MSTHIAPSLLAADFSRLDREVAEVQRAGADLIHLDIMDGHFVPNLTFGPPVVEHLAAHCTVPMDAHLMVLRPDDLVPALATAGVARVAVHVEAVPHLHRSLAGIRELGMLAGVAINPGTALGALDDALPFADFALVMSVNPGFGGQEFITETLDKIRRLRRRIGTVDFDITVDGGVDATNAAALVAAGATTLVAGSSIFGSEDRQRAVAELRGRAAGD
jgi:ribulose-phosphate 3-epimerase